MIWLNGGNIYQIFMPTLSNPFTEQKILDFFPGGSNGFHLKTSEIFKDGAFHDGPKLLQAVGGHCMIQLNKTHSILTGGYTNVNMSTVLYIPFRALR